MPGRTPSFIVVGLIIIMFLLGSFYLSCSSKNAELQQTLEEFKQRLHALNTKDDDFNRQIDLVNSRKQALEDETSNIKRQMSQKDDKFNDLSSQLNEKTSEFRKLNSEKENLDKELSDFKNVIAILSLRDAAIEKLQQELNDHNKHDNDQLLQLRQQLGIHRNQSNDSPLLIPNRRFQPLLSANETVDNSLLPKPLEKLNNITGELKDKIRGLFVPTDNDTQQAAREPSAANQKQQNSDLHQRLQRSLNDTPLDKNNRVVFNADKARQAVNLTSISLFNDTKIERKKYDVKDVDQIQLNEDDDEDLDDEIHNREQ